MNNEETNIETTGGFVEMNNNVISICIETADKG
jgi:F0F1-type ATP synthase epsilon subunit